VWVAGFRCVGGRPTRCVVLGFFGHEKWRAADGCVWQWLSWAEWTRRPFLSPVKGGGRR